MIRIVSTSLRKGSHSRELGRESLEIAKKAGIAAELIDLVDYPLPLSDGGDNSNTHLAQTVIEALRESTAIIFCSPIYNYDVSPALRNLLAHAGSSIEGKVVGLLCAAGGDRSYLAPLAFINSVMSHFRCLALPRYVYAPERMFVDGKLHDEETRNRVRELVESISDLEMAVRDVNKCQPKAA